MPSQSRILLNQTANQSASTNRRSNSRVRSNSCSSTDDSRFPRSGILPEDRAATQAEEDEDAIKEDQEGRGVDGKRRADAEMGLVPNEESSIGGASLLTAETSSTAPILGKKGDIDSGSPAARWTSAIKKTVQHNQRVNLIRDWQARTREPGINPKLVDLPGLTEKVVLQIADLSSQHVEFSVLTNEEVPGFLEVKRPEWSKVRWIHANGLSWDVIKPLALAYDLHPLSLEDMLHHGTSSTRSKADYYRQHLFVSVVVHKTLACSETEDNLSPEPPSLSHHLRESQVFHVQELDRARDEEHNAVPQNVDSGSSKQHPSHITFGEKLAEVFRGHDKDKEGSRRTLNSNMPGLLRPTDYPRPASGGSKRFSAANNQSRLTVAALTKDVKVHIHVEQLSIFLLRCGTIISFTQDPGFHSRFSTIFDRMQSPASLIRQTEDASFVLQALLDVVADHQLELIDEFRDEITNLEASVLARPDMTDVRHLHILSAQLLLLKSTLAPFQQLLQGLRMTDDAKAAAAISHLHDDHSHTNDPANKHAGFVSHEAKIYLSDVLDHSESVLSSLDLFSSLAENLIAFTFNNLSYSSNSYMQALSVLSVIFLPLTFLSGQVFFHSKIRLGARLMRYCGMNFGSFSAVLDNDVSYFWKIAAPTTVFTTLVFSWTYLSELFKSLRRQGIALHQKKYSKQKAY